MNIKVTVQEKQAREQAYALPLDKINVAQPILFQTDAMWPYFERLRKEDPVHYCADSAFGPFWSITKFNDIMAVDTNHQVFSSDFTLGGITIGGGSANVDPLPMFIAMDPPKHDIQRKVVSPVVSPANLEIAVELLSLPDRIRGFGPIKEKAVRDAKARYAELAADLANPPSAPRQIAAE